MSKTELKQIKQLEKVYIKQLKKENKNIIKATVDSPFDYLVTQLRRIRDKLIVINNIQDIKENEVIACLCIAINEYDLYKTCILDHYILNNRGEILEAINKNLKSEEVLENYNKEREEHWNNFWQLVQDCGQEWFYEDEFDF